MNLVRKQYDKDYYHNALAAKARRSQRDRMRLDLVREHVREGHLLEIGCGIGGFVDIAADCYDAHGIDISEYAVKHSRHQADGKVIQGDIQEMRLPADRYSVVAAFGLLEHLGNPDAVIKQVYGTLCGGGLFIASVPHNWGPLGKVATAIMDRWDRTHCSSYTPDRWRTMLTAAGFERITMFGEVAPTKGCCVMVRNPLWQYVSPNMVFTCRKRTMLKAASEPEVAPQ